MLVIKTLCVKIKKNNEGPSTPNFALKFEIL